MEASQHRKAWDKGKLVGKKPPLKPKDIWAIRIHLQNAHQRPGHGRVQLGNQQQVAWLRSGQFAG